ncbi:MAG: hypothetical protein ACP5O4_02835 [bacterium]
MESLINIIKSIVSFIGNNFSILMLVSLVLFFPLLIIFLLIIGFSNKNNESNTSNNDERGQDAGLEAGFTEPIHTDSGDYTSGDYYGYF